MTEVNLMFVLKERLSHLVTVMNGYQVKLEEEGKEC